MKHYLLLIGMLWHFHKHTVNMAELRVEPRFYDLMSSVLFYYNLI